LTSGRAGPGPAPDRESDHSLEVGVTVADVVFVLLSVAIFVALAVVARGAERL